MVSRRPEGGLSGEYSVATDVSEERVRQVVEEVVRR
ncbi:uncharacterized protein METZ01_LOCUS485057, partial [marine metagenome]